MCMYPCFWVVSHVEKSKIDNCFFFLTEVSLLRKTVFLGDIVLRSFAASSVLGGSPSLGVGFSLSTDPLAASSGGPRVPWGVTVCLVWTIGYRGAPDVRPEKGPLGCVTTVRIRCKPVRTRRWCMGLPRYLRYSRLGTAATGGWRMYVCMYVCMYLSSQTSNPEPTCNYTLERSSELD